MVRKEGVGRPGFEKFLAMVREIGGVLGILAGSPAEWSRRLQGQERKGIDETDTAWIIAKIADRDGARRDRNWRLADGIRDELLEKNVVLEDTAEGTLWRLKKR